MTPCLPAGILEGFRNTMAAGRQGFKVAAASSFLIYHSSLIPIRAVPALILTTITSLNMIELSENHQSILHVIMQSDLQGILIKRRFGSLYNLGIQMHQAIVAKATIFRLLQKLPCL